MTSSLRCLSCVWSLLALSSGLPVHAQLGPLSLAAPETADQAFARARGLAFDGKRAEALELCRAALLRNPDDHRVRVLIGRIHAWDGRYDEGRAALEQVLKSAPTHEEGRLALVDLEQWSDHPRAAIALCDEGLALGQSQAPLLYRKARALNTLGAQADALTNARLALAADPALPEAQALAENLVALGRRSKLSINTSYDRFDKTFEPWRMTSLSAAHRFDRGSLIGRVNLAKRFGETGQQLELDAYPKWQDGTYSYLNAGFSSDAIFPRQRYGGELHHNFPTGIEGSLGFRYLRFSSSNVTIYTGSVSKYWGDYLFSLRGNSVPSSIGASRSGAASVRRYLGGDDNHLTLSLGSGVSPDQTNLNAEILNLRSRKASLAAQGLFQRRFILSASFAYEIQGLSPGNDRAQTTFSLGSEWLF